MRGRSIQLSRTEPRILHYLMLRAGQVVSARVVVTELWSCKQVLCSRNFSKCFRAAAFAWSAGESAS